MSQFRAAPGKSECGAYVFGTPETAPISPYPSIFLQHCRSARAANAAPVADGKAAMKGADSRAKGIRPGKEGNGMFSRAIRRDVILLLCLKAFVLAVLFVIFFRHAPAV